MFPTGNVVDTLHVPDIGTFQSDFFINAAYSHNFPQCRRNWLYMAQNCKMQSMVMRKLWLVLKLFALMGAKQMGLIQEIAEA